MPIVDRFNFYRDLMQPGENGIGLADFLTRPEWHDRAACKGETDLMFTSRGEDTRPGKRLCDGCTVRDECLDAALELGTKFGIWGGMSERERRRIRRRRSVERRTAA